MNEVVKVSIAGVAFTFDAEAFEVMKNYLDTLENAYSASAEGREVVADIEARIAELILSRQEASRIVDESLAREIVEQLGYPEDMPKEEATAKLERRLYRNSEGAKMGGVCSGLGTYFGVDPSFVRIGIFLPMVFWLVFNAMDMDGVGDCFGSIFLMCILLYFTLLIAVPMAKTPRQKMEMRGEKITASSIHQTFKEEAAASTSANPAKSERSAGVWADVTYGIGRVIMFCIKALLILFAICFCGVGIGLLVALFAVLFGGAAIELAMLPIGGLVGISTTGYVALALVVVLLFVGLVGFILLSLAVGNKPERKAVTIFSTLFGISLLFFCIISARNLDTLLSPHHWESVEERFEAIEDWAEEVEDAFEDGDKISIDYDDATGRTQIQIRDRQSGEELVMEFDEDGALIEKKTTTSPVWQSSETTEKSGTELEIVSDTTSSTLNNIE